MEKWQEVKLENFNGPLDLLLNMVKDKKMELHDIDLLELSNQYIEYIEHCYQLDIEIASEYLVMVAYLLELKSKSLIPRETVEVEDDYEESQRDELKRRLIEYHKIKQIVGYFKEQQFESLDRFSKEKSIIKITKIDDDKLPLAENTINIDKFSKIFLKVLEKNKLNEPMVKTLTINELSSEEVSIEILEIIENSNKEVWSLTELLSKMNPSLQMLVAMFLAILDLTKKSAVFINQKENDIEITRNREYQKNDY